MAAACRGGSSGSTELQGLKKRYPVESTVIVFCVIHIHTHTHTYIYIYTSLTSHHLNNYKHVTKYYSTYIYDYNIMDIHIQTYDGEAWTVVQ